MKQKKETPEITRSTMVKKVNVIAQIPIRTVYPPIYGSYSGIMMSPSTIFKCILHKAVVEEILSDGSTIRLNATNYNTVNDPSDERVKQMVLENRKSAVLNRREDTRDITMKKLQTHTAPLPESHYLYNIKDKCDSKEAMDRETAAELDERYVNTQSEKSQTDPERELPVVDTESGDITGDSL